MDLRTKRDFEGLLMTISKLRIFSKMVIKNAHLLKKTVKDIFNIGLSRRLESVILDHLEHKLLEGGLTTDMALQLPDRLKAFF